MHDVDWPGSASSWVATDGDTQKRRKLKQLAVCPLLLARKRGAGCARFSRDRQPKLTIDHRRSPAWLPGEGGVEQCALVGYANNCCGAEEAWHQRATSTSSSSF